MSAWNLFAQKKIDAETLALAFILILAFAARLVGVHFGLPHLYHADEPILVTRALAYSGGDLNPHYFKHPPLVGYLLFILYGFYFLIARIFNLITSSEQFQNLFLRDPSSFYLLGRMFFGVLLGTLTVAFFFKLLKRHFSKTHAFISAVLLAVNFLHVQNSHYLWLDIPLLLVILLCFSFVFDISEGRGIREYILFGCFYGLAIGIKYNGFFILIPFLVAHFQGKGFKFKNLFHPHLFAAAFPSILIFLAVNPFSILDYKAFSNDLFHVGGFEGYVGWIHHLTYSLTNGVSLPVLIFSILGMGLTFFIPHKKKFLMLSFVILYYLVLVFMSQEHDRYVLPLVPFIVFFTSDFLVFVKNKFSLSFKISWLLVLLIALPSIVKVFFSDKLLLQTDIRTIAMRWVKENISSNSQIALDTPFFMPRLKPNVEQLRQKQKEALLHYSKMQTVRLEQLLQAAELTNEPRYELYFLTDSPTDFLFSKPTLPYDFKMIENLGIKYVMIPKIRPELRKNFYMELKKSATLVKRFSPYKDSAEEWAISPFPLTGTPSTWQEIVARERNGQIIELYKLSK